MDFEFSPSILDTPSLLTPNINTNPLVFKSSYTTTTVDINNDNNNNTSSSNPSSITTTTTNDESLSASSAEIKLSKIEDDLKQSFTQPRVATESPFRIIAKAGVLTNDRNVSIPPTTDDGIPVDVPSTAEVMNVLESFSKYPNRDNTERDTSTTLSSENNRLDTSPTHTMGVIVSPKKKLLIRSQSRTEPTSPTSISNNHFSQTQKLNFEGDDDENSNGDEHQPSLNNHFQRLHDLPLITHSMDSNPQLDNHLKPSYSIQLRTDQNGTHPTLIKQQPMILNNKRTFQQTVIGVPLPKATSIHIAQQPIINEVTSTGQLLGIKRQKMTPIPTNNVNLRSSTNDDNVGPDDQRKKQVRDSNREAARRCRERRRHYIEQLEGNLEQCKSQIKQLTEKVSRAESENIQLRAIVTESKIFQPSSRLSSNESIVDFANVLATTNGMDFNSESTDGNTIQRSYINRNTH